jgi:type II secretory pathway predicted ATPase ExeA
MLHRTAFGFTRPSFSHEIESSELFVSDSLRQCQARLDYLRSEKGAAAITGEVGLGKTAAIRYFLRRLPPSHYLVLYGAVPQLAKNPLRSVIEGWLEELGEKIPHANNGRGLRVLRNTLIDHYDKGRMPFLVIDEAHHLDDRGILLLKSLLNYDMDSRISAVMLLSGSPLLSRTLAKRSLEEIRQRLLFVYPLSGLTSQEMEPYIMARLKYAGCERQLFPRDIIDEMFRVTTGIPRLVNQLGNLCLLSAAQAHKTIVDSACLVQALKEMGLSEEIRKDPLAFALT